MGLLISLLSPHIYWIISLLASILFIISSLIATSNSNLLSTFMAGLSITLFESNCSQLNGILSAGSISAISARLKYKETSLPFHY